MGKLNQYRVGRTVALDSRCASARLCRPGLAFASFGPSLLCLLLLLGLLAVSVRADSADIAGTIEAQLDGRVVQFPSLSSSIDVDIQGDLARVRVTQRFQNPLSQPIHARYLFPLNKDAAVYGLTMNIGNERVRAVIKEKEAAQKTFTAAKKEGKAAVLLTQHRPNMFTQRIANLIPALPIEVIIEYTQTVAKIDEAYELVVPLVVGPRYNPLRAGNGTLQEKLSAPVAYAEVRGVDLPKQINSNRVRLTMRLESAVGFGSILSPSHATDVQTIDGSTRVVKLAQATTIANKDFVLRYTLGAKTDVAGGVLSYADERGGFFSLLVEPPQSYAPDAVLPREMVFLLDCSGSMSGAPMAASKAFMHEALAALRPQDTFRIIRFSDYATEFSRQPLLATPANVAAGLGYTQSLVGSGGTIMRSGVEQALMVPQAKGVVRNVVFLTDGYIGNEFEILGLVERELGTARLFALGVGSGVNRYLLDELARTGRGFVRYLDSTADVPTAAKDLAERLQTPLLTDLSIDWGDIEPTEVSPARLPDLYAGDSVRVQGRYTTPGQYAVTLSGRSGGARLNLPLTVSLKQPVESNDTTRDGSEAIALIWARSAVKDAMHQLSVPQQLRIDERSDDTLVQRVTQLGLDYSLATRWTSFVAVSEAIVNPDAGSASGLTSEHNVPLEKVAGVTNQAYPGAAVVGTAHGGYAAPEPAAWLGLALLALLMLLWFGAMAPTSLFAED